MPGRAVDLNALLFVFFYFSGDVFEQVFEAKFEVFVHVNIISVGMAYFSEAVHVELSDERGEVAVFEVGGQYFFCELGDAVDGEGVGGGGPADGVCVVFVLSDFSFTSII